MNLNRRLERMEAARPAPLTADEFWRLYLGGHIPESRFDAFTGRLSDEELQRSIAMVSAMIDEARGAE